MQLTRTLVLIAALTSSGCGVSSESPSACTPGESAPCSCTSGASGRQSCKSDGTLDACACGTTGSGGGSGGGGTTTFNFTFDVKRTGWTGAILPPMNPLDASTCSTSGLAVGLYGYAPRDSATGKYSLDQLGVWCNSLSTRGAFAVAGYTTLALGEMTAGMTFSYCPAYNLAVGVAYSLDSAGEVSGFAPLCAGLAWVDLAASVQPTRADVVGDPNPTSQLTCPRGYALTGLEGDSSAFRAVCTQLVRTVE